MALFPTGMINQGCGISSSASAAGRGFSLLPAMSRNIVLPYFSEDVLTNSSSFVASPLYEDAVWPRGVA